MTEMVSLGSGTGLPTLAEASPMVIGSTCPFKVGDLLDLHGHPFVVARESSEEEWRSSHPMNAKCPAEHTRGFYFYEVTTD